MVQLAEVLLPTIVQLAEGVKEPEALLEKLMVPDGACGVPVSLSVTVAVHVTGAFTGIVAGVQLSVVVVVRLVAFRFDWLELVEWSVSPP